MVELTSLDLSQNNLVVISGSLQLSTNLTEPRLRGNDLNGKIPMEIDALTKLEVLDVSRNEFTGTIPGSVLESRSMVYFDCSESMLTGTFPWSSISSPFTALLGGTNRFEGSIDRTAIVSLGPTLQNLQFPNKELSCNNRRRTW
jgi:Leucine-rich repeat (LRR) protein